MRRSKKGLILALVAAIVVVGLAAVIWQAVLGVAKRKTAQELLAMQEVHVARLSSLADQIDSSTALYLTDQINRDAYESHLLIARQTLAYLRVGYEEEMAVYPVEPGTQTASTRAGIDAVRRLYTDMDDMITVLEGLTTTQRVGYAYLGWHQKLADTLAVYMAAKAENASKGEGD